MKPSKLLVSTLIVVIVTMALFTFSIVAINVVVNTEPDPLSITAGEDDANPYVVITEPGGSFMFDRRVCSDRTLHIKVSRILRSEEGNVSFNLKTADYIMPVFNTNYQEECITFTFGTTIPDWTPPGDYTYIPTLVYDANFAKQIVRHAPTVRVLVQ